VYTDILDGRFMIASIDNSDNRSQGYDCFIGHSEMAALMRATDWSKTAVGPVESWPQSLKIVVRIMLTSRYAMWMRWGDAGTFFYNDAYRPTLGVKHPWALGAHAHEVWAEIWSEIGPRIETVLRTGEATWDEGLLLFLERSGYPEETYHTFSYSPLADDNGKIDGMLCVVTEDTDRVIGERRLALLREIASALASAQSREAVFAAICDRINANSPDLPFTLTYLYAADGASADLACTTGIPDGHPLAIAKIDSDAPHAPWPAQQILTRTSPILMDDLTAHFPDLPSGPWGQAPRQAIVVPLAQQGQERPAGFLVAAINPYRQWDADYEGFVGLLAGQIAAGIANASAYENERKRAEALAELDRAKTIFFSNVSHEFRTPLTLMMGPLEDALAAPQPALEGENLEVVHRNSLRLLKLVNTLLDFSRIEAGRVQAIYEPTDLSVYTTELASVFRSAVERADMQLIVDCPPLSEPVYVDREMWEKVVLNLLSNAFKFTEAGEIAVTLREENGTARLSVRDTGTGISEEQLPHIFERFHRVEGTRARTHEGTGIGLALVQELVRLHGGEVTVSSVYGEGSTFTVTIPLGDRHLPQERIRGTSPLTTTALGASPYVEEALRWLPDQSATGMEGDLPAASEMSLLSTSQELGFTQREGEDSTGSRSRILVADDNADMRVYVARLLRQRYEVMAVPDGQAALEAAKAWRPDLVLSDVMMPHLSGFELLQALRSDPCTVTIPVILLSARAGEEARVEGISVGADDYLTKPFSAKELLARVRAHLEVARVRREAAEAIRESEERLRAALDASEMGTFRWDIGTGALEWDENLNRLFGRASDDKVRTLDAFLAAVHPDERVEVIERCRRCAEEGADFDMEYRVVWPNGTVRWIYDRGKTFLDGAGNPISMTGACVDVTERKLRQAQIEALNARLRRAMTETHHRVKNNLQLMSALIDMQRQDKRDAVPVSELLRLSQNIQALGVIHEILTQEAKEDGDAAHISTAAVLGRLLPMLQHALEGRQLRFTVDDIKLPGRKATSLALITNELISNAAKHGKGDIEITFRTTDITAMLEVCDDGPGFPADFNPVAAAHTGLELIENIARWDLGGTPAYANRPEGGARITITFPSGTGTGR
jgi:PAS domain S-box-containing protein